MMKLIIIALAFRKTLWKRIAKYAKSKITPCNLNNFFTNCFFSRFVYAHMISKVQLGWAWRERTTNVLVFLWSQKLIDTDDRYLQKSRQNCLREKKTSLHNNTVRTLWNMATLHHKVFIHFYISANIIFGYTFGWFIFAG